ncbi:MAG: D-aminoacyl-tRNA deacylase [Culicoidibacterales bacterium]
MRCVVQRVTESQVSVDGVSINAIQNGYMILVGITHADDESVVAKMIAKIEKLRIFEDENGKMNKSIKDVEGEILAISQFTLYGNAKKGNRPDFLQAASFEKAKSLYDYFLLEMNKLIPTKGGVFGGDMKISLINDGPVTLILDSDTLF